MMKTTINENFQIDVNDYDVIIGYRADDSYFSFAQDFVSNLITLKQLSRAMHLGKLGEQIVLKSQDAFDRLQFIEARPAERDIYYSRKLLRDRDAKTQYRKIAEQFGKGNPRYVAGKTGCEIAREIFEECNISIDHIEDVMYVEKSPEYWAGWILCYYQWFTGRSFSEIYRSVTIEQILKMYPTLHEADVSKFIDIMEEKLKDRFPETNLKRMRILSGLSQSQLAEVSGVSIRQIQLFEQRERDINKTQALTLLKLAKALSCDMEQLLEY